MYRNPALTVDVIISTPGGIVLIRRRNEPFQRMWALPGGFVNYGETVEAAAAREVEEETGLIVRDLRQFHVYSDPERDPRQHIVSVVFTATADGMPHARDDAAEVAVFPVNSLPSEMAFDHAQILLDWISS